MLTVAILATAVGTLSWTPNADLQLIGVGGSGKTAVSRDPNVTYANIAAGIGGTPDYNLVSFYGTPGIATMELPKIPMVSGEPIYVAFSAAGTAILYFDTPTSA